MTQACESETINDSEFTTSAAEESCDTVIYVGPKGEAISEQDLTDFEGPPSFDDHDRSVYDDQQVFDDLSDFPEPPNFDVIDTLGLAKPQVDLVLDTELPPAVDTRTCSTEILERNCSCNLQNCSTSNTCIHTTGMKSVDTDFLSNSSLLASFSNDRGRSSSTLVSRGTSKDNLGSYKFSEDAREALSHSTSPYYYLVPGCPGSSLENLGSRRYQRGLDSNRERISSRKLSSSQERICLSPDRGRVRSRNLPMSTPASRTASLDRYYSRNEQEAKDTRPDPCGISRSRSEESIASSQQTVENFERELVSKIVERFDVENEISDMEPDLISRYLEQEQIDAAEEEQQSRRLAECIKRLSVDDSIVVTVTSQERLDPLYIDSLNLSDLLRKQREDSIVEFQRSNSPQLVKKSEQDLDEQFDLLLNKTWERKNETSKDPHLHTDDKGDAT